MAFRIRTANLDDEDELFRLVSDFATSFQPKRSAFQLALTDVLNDRSAWLNVAETEGHLVGYLLGFVHQTFFANGSAAWIEEVMVHEDWRLRGIGRTLTVAFEKWAETQDSRLVALATRRAAPFYEALGYEDSATYFRKVLPHTPPNRNPAVG